MPTTLDLSGLTRLQARFAAIQNPDARPLIKTLMDVIHDDNREGVLAGLDKDGNTTPKVRYRPNTLRQKLTAAQRGNQHPSSRAGVYNAGPGGNLKSSEYARLDGPALAPRKQFSRVITNLLTDFDDSEAKDGRWTVWGYWDEVVSKKGYPFLIAHFEGQNHLPVRDLRGLRPVGVRRARTVIRHWMVDQIRSNPAA